MGLKDLSSYKSLWRGYEYYLSKMVIDIQKINDEEFDSKVRNEENHIYDIHLNMKHPRKSTCNCPHANGKRIICKHMIATYFTVFPEEAKGYIKEIEDYEKVEKERYREYLKKQEEEYLEIKKYVNQLSLEELREKLISYMMSEDYNEEAIFY